MGENINAKSKGSNEETHKDGQDKVEARKENNIKKQGESDEIKIENIINKKVHKEETLEIDMIKVTNKENKEDGQNKRLSETVKIRIDNIENKTSFPVIKISG